MVPIVEITHICEFGRAALAGTMPCNTAGCTVHIVDEGMDTGPMLAKASIPIDRSDDAATLSARLSALGAELLQAIVDNLENPITMLA